MEQNEERPLTGLLTVAEVAQQYTVSARTVERWVERGLPAEKTTEEQILVLLKSHCVRGLPPQGVNFVWNSWIARAFCSLILSSMPGGAAATHGIFGIPWLMATLGAYCLPALSVLIKSDRVLSSERP